MQICQYKSTCGWLILQQRQDQPKIEQIMHIATRCAHRLTMPSTVIVMKNALFPILIINIYFCHTEVVLFWSSGLICANCHRKPSSPSCLLTESFIYMLYTWPVQYILKTLTPFWNILNIWWFCGRTSLLVTFKYQQLDKFGSEYFYVIDLLVLLQKIIERSVAEWRN